MVWFSYLGANLKKPYLKPHLTVEKQIDLLKSRGLAIQDEIECQDVLSQVGYYRIAAYLYPFRRIKPKKERTTQWNYRYDAFDPGHEFSQAVALYRFDEELRNLVFEALTVLEVSLRTAIAFHGGKRNGFIHLNREFLDENVCNTIPKNSQLDSYSLWSKGYKSQLDRAKSEDYISHHLARYGDQVPIWIATEFLDFGSVVYLFSYLPKDIQSKISRNFGSIQGSVVLGWFRNFNYIRNVIAHHSRLWNRRMVLRVQQPHPNVVDKEIHHLAEMLTSQHFKKIYPTLALIAYTISFVDPENDWATRLAWLIYTFPEIEGVNPINDMGFPEGWENQALWCRS